MIAQLNDTPIYAYTGSKALNPAQPTLVFLHGAANDHSVWALQSRYFAHHGYNVLALDLPGHGRSGGAVLDSVEALADWVPQALTAFGSERATLIGHSMGSLVALETAARSPTRVDGIVLVGSNVPMGVSDALLTAARDDTVSAIAMITQWSHAPASLLGGAATPGFWLPGGNSALMRRAAPGVLHRDLANCQAYTGGLDAAARLNCPVQLILGSRDLMTPVKATQVLREALPGAKVTIIDGAGHAMLSEAPDAVLAAMKQFVASLRR
jgi:pimeloyl-ACP methyl ester carboxylesterase